MTPEAAAFLEKARRCLGYARRNPEAGLANDAGRNAYLAAFHAAQALIFDRTSSVARTHAGVDAAFNRLVRDDGSFPSALRSVIARTYLLKAVADYEYGPGSEIPPERAEAGIGEAEQFLTAVTALLAPPGT